MNTSVVSTCSSWSILLWSISERFLYIPLLLGFLNIAASISAWNWSQALVTEFLCWGDFLPTLEASAVILLSLMVLCRLMRLPAKKHIFSWSTVSHLMVFTKRKVWKHEEVCWTWEIIWRWSGVTGVLTESLCAWSKSVACLPVTRRWRWWYNVIIGAWLGSPGQSLDPGSGVRMIKIHPRPLRIQWRRGWPVSLRTVLHWVPPQLVESAPVTRGLLEEEPGQSPALVSPALLHVITGHIRLIIIIIHAVPVLQIILGSAPVQHSLDHLWRWSSGSKRS